jgi:AGZA family xanthine/uracil permease-like MFS transporter
MPLRLRLERYFEFQALGADWKTEVLAGFTTFMTMAYIQLLFWNSVSH